MDCEIAGCTAQGPVRERNEDHLLIGEWLRNSGWLGLALPIDDELIQRRGLLLAVADGMGGEAGGQVASRLALTGLAAALARTTPPGGAGTISGGDLIAALHQVNADIRTRQTAQPELASMGSTLSAVLLTGTGYWLLHAGDSRVLRVRNGFVRRLTRDDTFAERLIDQLIDAETALSHPDAALLTNWLGSDSFQPGVQPGPAVEPGDCLLIASDGLHAFLSEDALAAAIVEPGPRVTEMARHLVDAAIAAGSSDNVSAIVIRFVAPATELIGKGQPWQTTP